jgi:hypothetical protein
MTLKMEIAEWHKDLLIAKSEVYDKCDFALSGFHLEEESQEYGACVFYLNKMKIIFRMAKTTPTKTGQFVTIWKRNKQGITEPFDTMDEFDFIIISSRLGKQFGQFIFPKIILLDKGIISGNGKDGKRGIRVYPPLDKTTNKQAEKTQSWQTKFFLPILQENSTNLDLAKQLFSVTNKPTKNSES